MKRREDVSIEAFRKFWNSAEFNELIDRAMGYALTIEVKKNLTLDIELNQLLREERNAKPAFDGILEVVWQSGSDLSVLLDDPDFQRLTQELQAVQQPFVDFIESRRFFTEYNDASS
ncbi:MAG: hypothetical protein PVF93_04830 [Chromatiaceae bacterium]|jgi:hypothetical protein